MLTTEYADDLPIISPYPLRVGQGADQKGRERVGLILLRREARYRATQYPTERHRRSSQTLKRGWQGVRWNQPYLQGVTMPANDPAQYEMEDELMPWPSDTNDKPFMTYDKLMTGAPGKPAPKQ